ncbi:MAG TPA: hypothetical protein VMM38_03445 [Aridibacter sp.]|nr:hypothetical protein [Aridibacter sp.]
MDSKRELKSLYLRTLSTFLLLFSVIGGSACLGPNELKACPVSTSSDFYFPKGSFYRTNEERDNLAREITSPYLAAMGEPSLSCGKREESYRFVWLRSFDRPVAVRITIASGLADLTAVQLEWRDGIEPGDVALRRHRVLNKKALAEFRRVFSAVRFNDLSYERRDLIDGSVWIVESTDGENYKVVTRDSPENGPIRELGLYFLAVTGWKFT